LERPPRELVPREVFALVERLAAPERVPAELRPVDAAPPAFEPRPDAVLVADEADVFAARPLLEREPVPLDLVPVERVLLERPVADFADDLPEPLVVPPDDESSSPHLPLITRWAASATASAISEPRRVALDIAVVAALDAASAASSPASRILRRAAGLALIAAAAAARPAAIISRLIATFVILSTVASFELREEPEEDPELLFFDLAMVGLPLSRRKTLQKRNGSEKSGHCRGSSNRFVRIAKQVKGDRRQSGDPLRHGQRPEVPTVPESDASASPRERYVGPTPLLNHETSDHLLSLC
jgi:hypothetical protein